MPRDAIIILHLLGHHSSLSSKQLRWLLSEEHGSAQFDDHTSLSEEEAAEDGVVLALGSLLRAGLIREHSGDVRS